MMNTTMIKTLWHNINSCLTEQSRFVVYFADLFLNLIGSEDGQPKRLQFETT